MVGGVLNVNSTAKLVWRTGWWYTPSYGNKWFWFFWTNDKEITGDDDYGYWYTANLRMGVSSANSRLNLRENNYKQYRELNSFCIEIK